MRNEIETKRNETKRNEINENETKRNETKRNQQKRNETKRNQRNENETKRNQRKQNEINENKTKYDARLLPTHVSVSFIRRGQDLITIEQEYYAFIALYRYPYTSCNNVAPVKNLCLGRATTRSHSSQWSKKKVAVET